MFNIYQYLLLSDYNLILLSYILYLSIYPNPAMRLCYAVI